MKYIYKFNGSRSDLFAAGFKLPRSKMAFDNDYMFLNFLHCRGKCYMLEYKEQKFWVTQYLKDIYQMRTIKSKKIILEVLTSVLDRKMIEVIKVETKKLPEPDCNCFPDCNRYDCLNCDECSEKFKEDLRNANTR